MAAASRPAVTGPMIPGGKRLRGPVAHSGFQRLL